MRSLEFKINSVEQLLKTCKSGWALNYWNTVLQQLHARRDMTFWERQDEYLEYQEDDIVTKA